MITPSSQAVGQALFTLGFRIWNGRLPHLASLMIILLQRGPLMRVLADGRLTVTPRLADVWKLTAGVSVVHLTGTHAVTGATQPTVNPVSPSTNPAEATVGEDFVWVFSASIPGKKARSYRVENLPPGIEYDGRVASNSFASIRGIPTAAGMFTVEITAFHFANQAGEASPVYELALDVIGDAQPDPPRFLEELQNQFLTRGSSVTLSVQVEGNEVAFFWEKDGQPIPDRHEASLPLENVTLADSGTYAVRVVNEGGEIRSSAEVRVVTREVPIPAGHTLYSISARAPELRALTSEGSTAVTVALQLEGHEVTGGTGLALDPVNQVLYAMLKLAEAPEGQVGDRVLATLDPLTGRAALIGNPGAEVALKFAALAFDATGQLYGVTGDDQGAAAPETLFAIDKTTGTARELFPLGNGDQGEALAFDPVSGHLLHASGGASPQSQVLERIDPLTGSIFPLAPQGRWTEGRALVSLGGGEHLIADEETIHLLTAEGGVVAVGVLDHVTKGLALVPPSPEIFRITRIERTAEGAVLAFPVRPGDTFRVESSQNLIDWEERLAGTAEEDQVEIEFTDPGQAGGAVRFYRAVRGR